MSASAATAAEAKSLSLADDDDVIVREHKERKEAEKSWKHDIVVIGFPYHEKTLWLPYAKYVYYKYNLQEAIDTVLEENGWKGLCRVMDEETCTEFIVIDGLETDYKDSLPWRYGRTPDLTYEEIAKEIATIRYGQQHKQHWAMLKEASSRLRLPKDEHDAPIGVHRVRWNDDDE